MPAPFFPQEATRQLADELGTRLVNCQMMLFKSGFVPSTLTELADIEAQEADYTGYARVTIAAWGNPIDSDVGGAQITAPTVQFSLAADPALGNTIGGYALVVPAVVGPPALPEFLLLIRQFDTPVPMLAAFDGLTVTPTIVQPNGT